MKWSLQSLYDSTASNITWAYEGAARTLEDARIHCTATTYNLEDFAGLDQPDSTDSLSSLHEIYHGTGDQEDFYKSIHELTISNVDTVDVNGYTLLHKALYHGQPQLVKVLLEKGADLFKEGPNRSNFLQFLAECKDHKKVYKIFKEFINDPAIKNKIVTLDPDLYKEVIKIAIVEGNSKLAQTLIELHHSKKTILEKLLNDAQPTEEEKIKIDESNKDIIKLEKTIDELKAASYILEQLEVDLGNQSRIINQLENELKSTSITPEDQSSKLAKKKRADILYKRIDDALKKKQEQIGILVSSNSKTIMHAALDKQIQEAESKLSLIRAKNKHLIKPHVEQIIKIQSLLYKSVDKTPKYSFLKEAVEKGDSNKVRLLLEAESKTEGKKYYNLLYGDDNETILNTCFKKINEIEEKLKELEKKLISSDISFKKYKEEHERHTNILKDFYNIAQLIIQQPEFNLKSTLDCSSQKFLLDAYIYSKESINNETLEITYQKKVFFETLFKHEKTQEYLLANPVELLKATAKYNDPETYFKIHGLPGFHYDLSLQDQNEILFYAAQSGSQRIFDKIIEIHPTSSFNAKFESNSNMLMYACKGGNLEIVETILREPVKFAVKINQVDNIGNSALHYLANSKGQDNKEIINRLIEEGADIEAKNKFGHTPLINAVLLGNVAAVKELLAKGADVNAIDKEGNTPLIYAVKLNNPEVIEAILSANELDVSHKNNKGISAYTISLSRDFIVDAIKSDSTSKTTNSTTEENFLKAESDKANEAITQHKNKYQGLSKILLSRGADPYKVSPTTLADLALTTSLAAGAIQVTNMISNIKDPWGIGGTLGAVLKAGTSFLAGAAIYSSGSDYVKGVLERALKKDSEKTSLEDEVMIGTTHRGSWFKIPIIKKGASLQKDMGNHKNFKDAEKGVFTYAQLEQRVKDKVNNEDFKAWAVKSQKALQDKYITTKKSLEKTSFTDIITGRRKALEQNLAEILAASDLFIKHVGVTDIATGKSEVKNETFDNINSKLVEIIRSSQQAKQLLAALIKSEYEGSSSPDIKEIDNIIKMVTEKSILTSPETYYAFCEFEKLRKQICKNKKTREGFLNSNNDLGFTVPKIEKTIQTANSNLKDHTSVDLTILEKKQSPTLLKRTIELLQDITTKYIITEPVQQVISSLGGAALASETLTRTQPEIANIPKKLITIAKDYAAPLAIADSYLGSPVQLMTSAPIKGVAYVATRAVSLAANHPVAATIVGATAIAAAYYRPWEYFYTNRAKEKLRLEPSNIGKSSIPDLLTEQELGTRKEKQLQVLSNLFSPTPKHKESNVTGNHADAAKVIQKQAKKYIKQKKLERSIADDLTSRDTFTGISTKALEKAKEVSAPVRGIVRLSKDTLSETASMSSDYSHRTSFSDISEEELLAARKVAEPARKLSKIKPTKHKTSVIGRFLGRTSNNPRPRSTTTN